MDGKPELSTAEIADRHSRLIALVMLLMAVYFGTSAAGFVVGQEAARYLDMVGVATAVLGMGLLLPIMFWKILKLPKEDRPLYFSSDGYVAQTLAQAKNLSWVSTFVLLMFIDPLTKEALQDLPTSFFLKVVLAAMLGVFGGAFFFLNREEEHHDLGGESNA